MNVVSHARVHAQARIELQACLIFFSIGALVAPAGAVSYTAKVLSLPQGATNSVATGISGTDIVGYWSRGNGPDRALLWSDSSASPVDLHPNVPGDAQESEASAVSGTNQGGRALVHGEDHAMLWSGTAASAVDLHPVGYDESGVFGVSGNSQVGFAVAVDISNIDRAMLWKGTAVSAVDLTPRGFTDSAAYGVSGDYQVGFGDTPDGARHALLWHGTAASAVDLTPAGNNSASVAGIDGSSQVGYTGDDPGFSSHAYLWHGTAESGVDLHPAGYLASAASGVAGGAQVGTADSGLDQNGDDVLHAMLWHGSAASAIDLSTFLPSDLGLPASTTPFSSWATAISDDGVIVGWAGYLFYQAKVAVVWTPVPQSGVAGDYNNNGVVDMADYILWRTGTNALNNEVATPGVNTAEDYAEWRARFGNILAHSANLKHVPVPEPDSELLLLLSAFVFPMYGRRRELLNRAG